jgi:biotin-dependent carboxylase-like uncharacterized protein
MTTARFTIDHAGPQISLQDQGRFGLLRYGVPASGPMDRFAFSIANLALGKLAQGTAIEVSLGGLTLICTEGCVSFAVAGGDFQIFIDKNPVSAWCIATVQKGQTLCIKPGRWGSWCYLTFAGNLHGDLWFGSTSTHGPSGLGGGKLATGGSLRIDGAETRETLDGPIPRPVSGRPRHNIRVVLGPQDRFFNAKTIAEFLSQPFTLTDAYDRMGVRLSGPALPPNATLDMPSEAILRGAIQVAGDGVATVLLADHQTTGGYPKIATILSDDQDGFVQLRSRNIVNFEAISAEAAISATRTQFGTRAAFLAKISLLQGKM